MNYQSFFKKFGGSARTKNILKDLSKASNKRPYPLPSQSGLPNDFIRLCPWEMEYLYLSARRARKGILEIGRFNGGSTFLLACSNPDVPIYSIDISPRNDDYLRTMFETHEVGKNVELIVGDSRQLIEHVRDLDVLFIDGDHGYEGCYADITVWYPRLNHHGHLLLHDSYLGDHGVQDAIVDFMQLHPELDVLVSPLIGASYWNYPAGSMAHLWKRNMESVDQGQTA